MPDSATIPGIIDEAIAEATAWGVKQLEVILIRHGQPLPEEERRGREALDPPLSALGRRQAEAATLALDRNYFVRPAHASISRVCLSAGRWRLQSVNETAHLRPDLLTA